MFLGARSLTIGSNSRNTTFSGVVQDGGLSGKTGGSLIKSRHRHAYFERREHLHWGHDINFGCPGGC